ncbi:MAG: hypothetical protein ACTSRG_19055 [Candidatus Helarchaeota archaeon]
MPSQSEEIKKIMKINDEINDLISILEKKQRNISSELINLIIEKDQRIAELEQEISRLKGVPVSKISTPIKSTISEVHSTGRKADLTSVFSGIGVKSKKPGHTKVEEPIKTVTEKVLSSPSQVDKSSEVKKSATISRYSSVAVLKRPSGSSKFKPRSLPSKPKSKPISTTEEPPPKKHNKDALILLDNLKNQISEDTTTHELYKILENIRDELANLIGFCSVIRDIGTVSNKLKHAPDLALDESSIDAFRKKVDKWKENV